MSNPRPKLKATLRTRVTADTKFYVDYDWWEKSDLDIKTYLYTRLPIEDETSLDMEREVVDLVDSQTGQVRQVDGFQYVIQIYFSQLPKDFLLHTSMVDAIFCALLANANEPMTAQELADQVRKPITIVLKTLSGPRVYQGIRPIFEDS
ncbi:MAG: hypothetical protein GY803_13060 [Chloroflexi bacterium]|nr:hypothetical protein [Chloroflexota bacterium]